MWKLLEQAAKSASVNASGYVNSVQEKAQSLAAAVQDEASTLLNSAMGSARSGPVDEILYEELADYKEFCAFFSAEEHTHEITRAVNEDETIRELHDLLVPLELSYDEFWCRYFFRQQQGEKHEKERKMLLLEHKQAPEDEDEEEEDEALAGDDEHKSVETARDAERRAANQWRQKARDLHHQLQETKQLQDENEQKAMKEWEEQLQALCDTYETKMAAATMQIDEARATGYDEGVRESQAIVESVRQAAEEDINRLRTEITEGGQASGSVDERVDALVKEKDELQQALQVSRDRLAELEKCTTAPGEKAGDAALAELAKEKDLWRMRALKMKKLKDLVQAELTSLRQQRNADTTAASENITAGTDDHSKLQSRMNELQAQLANAVAGAEARAREAYEKGVTAGKADAEQRAKQEREQAFSEGYKKAQAEAKSEVGVLKAELGMFRAFHESAAYAAEMVEDSSGLLNDSLDDISLADGAPLCSPTSSISIFTDNGKNDFATPEVSKSTDDWGEW
ncbi:hypothetical protein BBJ29_006532 [Phytophthora kernoviae]|uniref:BSD domain-containing protein n=1 Tax=Phytophthora kernoviae TaxID=325452 RepID=A0A3F2RZ67_9STRA|nr:hypothetical protein BBJ29_006532 [Phytophthora kernoviae]RLN67063.1 hypothetical protein BBP00_00001846 [Phytophthora kernoviae]